jgi:hypothetical protein
MRIYILVINFNLMRNSPICLVNIYAISSFIKSYKLNIIANYNRRNYSIIVSSALYLA